MRGISFANAVGLMGSAVWWTYRSDGTYGSFFGPAVFTAILLWMVRKGVYGCYRNNGTRWND